jgi:hypothetical protein
MRDQGVIVTVVPDDAQLFVSLVSITVFPLSAQASKKVRAEGRGRGDGHRDRIRRMAITSR